MFARQCSYRWTFLTAAAALMLVMSGHVAQAASIKGTINFEGRIRKRRPVRMDADPNCAKVHDGIVLSELYIHNEDDSRLANVFVYVSKGAKAAPGKPHEIDQKGCLYIPHVSGMVAGEKLKILNSDNTLHNVNVKPKKNSPFNKGMGGGTSLDIDSFSKPEMDVPFKCDVHPWMGATLHIMEHPYFAVSDKDGNFEIKGLPAGDYEIAVEYESSKYKPDKKSAKVSVGADETKEISFTYARPKKKSK